MSPSRRDLKRPLRAGTVPVAALATALSFLAPALLGAGETLLPRGSAWSYLDDGSDQGTAWRFPGFDDSSWNVGLAELGYGDGDEVTEVSFGADEDEKFITTWFRTEFTILNPADWTALELLLKRDDGAVVYLNGTEVRRDNLPSGEIDFETEASGANGESDFHSSEIPAALLVEGVNVFAVEVHQSGPTSSDISFDLELIGSGPGAPEELLPWSLPPDRVTRSDNGALADGE